MSDQKEDQMVEEETFYFHSGLIKASGKKKPLRATAAGVVRGNSKGRFLHIGLAVCNPNTINRDGSHDTFVKLIGRGRAYSNALSTGDRHNSLKEAGKVANVILGHTSDPRKMFLQRAVAMFNQLGIVYWFKTDLKDKTYEEIQLEDKYTNAILRIRAKQTRRKTKIATTKSRWAEAAKEADDKLGIFNKAVDDGVVYDPDQLEEEKNMLLDLPSDMNHSPTY